MFKKFEKEISNKDLTIVFIEGEDRRIIKATKLLLKRKICKVILLGEEGKIEKFLGEENIKKDKVIIIDPKRDENMHEKVQYLFKLRNGKNTLEECKEMLTKRNYYGVLLVKLGIASACIGGAIYSTKEIIKPAFQIIKGKKGIDLVSSSFILTKKNYPSLLMADCAIIEEPSSEDLLDIAISSVDTYKTFIGGDPKVAFLSYSTKGSNTSPLVDKVKTAVNLLKEKKANFVFDGEIQFDAAVNFDVAQRKCPNSPLKGDASVFIFPDLNSANIGYKIAQRFGNYEAIGPILQGLDKPVNDLSRGCTYKEVYKMSLISLKQAIEK